MEADSGRTIPTSAEEKLAQFISFIFHPLLMPTYGFVLLFFTNNYISTFTTLQRKVLIILVTFIFTFLLPSINAYILLKMGRIKSLSMDSSDERLVPYTGAAVYFFSLYYLFTTAEFPNIFKVFILGAAISIVLTLLINFKWKISAHTIGIGGMVGGMLGVVYRLHVDLHFILMLIILASGLVAYARLKLNAHTPAQVYTGFLLGFLVELFLMIFY